MKIAGGSGASWSGAAGFYTVSSSVNPRWVSSQAISGGTIIGGLNYPADWVIYSSNGYYAKNRTGELYTNADATTTIQYAISKLYNIGGGVVITNGTYDIGSTIHISSNDISLQGTSRGTKLLMTAATDCIEISGAANNIYIGHITLDGDTQTGKTGIYVPSAMRSNIDDVYIKGFELWGAHFAYNHTFNLLNSRIDNCGISSSLAGSGKQYLGGLKIGEDPNVRELPFNFANIENCIFTWNFDGIWVIGGTNIIIKNCDIEGNNRNGIVLCNLDGSNYLPQVVNIDSCYFEDNNAHNTVHNYPNVADILGSGTIYNTSITNSYFSGDDVDWNIKIGKGGSAEHIRVDSNRFNTATTTNIDINDTTDLIIGNNRLTTTPVLANCSTINLSHGAISSQAISGGTIKGTWQGDEITQPYLKSGSEYWDAYLERGSQIAGNNLTWNGTQLDAAAGGGAGGYPSGADGAVQYKSGTSHGGQHQLYWDRIDNKLIVSGNVKSYSVSAQTISGGTTTSYQIYTDKISSIGNTDTFIRISGNDLGNTDIVLATDTGQRILYKQGSAGAFSEVFSVEYGVVNKTTYLRGPNNTDGSLILLARTSGTYGKHYPTISLIGGDYIKLSGSSIKISSQLNAKDIESVSLSSNIIKTSSYISASTGLYANFVSANNINLTKCGFSSISNGGTILHGLPRLPTFANVTPSGSAVNFGTTCKVDATNITVYMTAAGNRDIYWTASC